MKSPALIQMLERLLSLICATCFTVQPLVLSPYRCLVPAWRHNHAAHTPCGGNSSRIKIYAAIECFIFHHSCCWFNLKHFYPVQKQERYLRESRGRTHSALILKVSLIKTLTSH